MRSYVKKFLDGMGDDDRVRPSHKRKDTKRWCKGKVGREHFTAIQRSQIFGIDHPCHVGYMGKWVCYHNVVCTVCGKILKEWGYGFDCPDRED